MKALTASERHAILCERGWQSRLDGKLRSPDPSDLRAYTLAAAWDVHLEHEEASR